MFKDIKQHKEEIREQYRAIRKDIDESYYSYAANSLVNLFSQNLSCIKGKTIAAYTPIDGEINVALLIHHLLSVRWYKPPPSRWRNFSLSMS